MNIDDVIEGIKDESLKAMKEEFLELLGQAKKDENDFLKFMAEQTAKTLVYYAEGKIKYDDVMLVLKKGKKIAQIEANNANIKVLAKLQKITYRLLDIAIDGLVKAIIPV
ncbi:MAG TPA: hypothetical protein VF682_19140 [Pseudomonas sp.]|jgi:ribosomal protein L16 Arg81 hydroxylase